METKNRVWYLIVEEHERILKPVWWLMEKITKFRSKKYVYRHMIRRRIDIWKYGFHLKLWGLTPQLELNIRKNHVFVRFFRFHKLFFKPFRPLGDLNNE